MKKYDNTVRGRSKVVFVSVIVLITSFSGMVMASHEQPADSLVMTYSFQSPTLSKISIKNDVYDQILLQNAPCSGNPGEPFLPTKGAYLLLPPNTKVDTIAINGEKTFVGSGFKIVPCGKSIPLTPHAVNAIPTPNKAVYSSDTLFPGRVFLEIGLFK
jgi:hypothetical protein